MLKKLFDTFNLRSEFKRNVLVTSTGMVAAQAIPVLVSPLLTRLYSPKDFGIFALFTSIAAVLGVFATGRYEQAITVPEDESEAMDLVLISVVICALFSGVSWLGVFLYAPERLWLHLLPVSAFLTGVYQSFYFWNNRQKEFQRIAKNRFFQALMVAAISVGLGFWIPGAEALIGAYVLGQVLATARLAYLSWIQGGFSARLAAGFSFKHRALQHRDFPVYMIPSSLVNVLANQIPVFILGRAFGAEVLGFFSLAVRVLGMPVNFIGSAIGDVLRQRASEDLNRSGNCKAIVFKALQALALIGIPVFLVLGFFGPRLFAFIFGSEWLMTGEYVQLMSVRYLFGIVISPLSVVLIIANRQRLNLIWQVAMLLLTTAGLWAGVRVGSPDKAILFYSLAYAAMYVIYLKYILEAARGRKA